MHFIWSCPFKPRENIIKYVHGKSFPLEIIGMIVFLTGWVDDNLILSIYLHIYISDKNGKQVCQYVASSITGVYKLFGKIAKIVCVNVLLTEADDAYMLR